MTKQEMQELLRDTQQDLRAHKNAIEEVRGENKKLVIALKRVNKFIDEMKAMSLHSHDTLNHSQQYIRQAIEKADK